MKLNHWILFASGVVSALLISTAYDAPLIAQTATTPADDLPELPAAAEAFEATNIPQIPQIPPIRPQSTPQSAGAPEVAQTLPAREPTMTMSLEANRVSVYLVNETTEAIIYEALGDTEPRTLNPKETVNLQNLSVPATVTFSYETTPRDRQTGSGLTKATLTSEQSNSLLTLVVQPTTDLDSEVSNLTVESNGNVFVF